MRPTLRELAKSGELDRLLKKHGTWMAVARHLGVSDASIRKARVLARGIPDRDDSLITSAKRGHVYERHLPLDINGDVELDVSDFAEEEPTLTDVGVPRVEHVEEVITQVEEHRLKKRVRDLESENRKLVEQLSDGGEYNEVIADVIRRQHEQRTTIEPRERTSGLREATPLVLVSDLHLEEEVRPEQVAGRNRYNLEISARRMERLFEAARWGIEHQREVSKIRDLVCWLGGDIITNFLHDDNIETNLLHPTEALLFAQDCFIKGIDYWLQDSELEQLVFPCNDGNHGRLTEYTRAATRTQNSLETFLYAQLANHYRNEPRVKFILPTSAFTFLDGVYGKTIRFTHGDTFNYSGGVGGITVPLFKALARWESVKHADLTCLGHWHQRICLPTTMVNGSLIGYSAYAMSIGCPFEHPVQSMRMLDSRRWCSTDIPLWVSDRDDDQGEEWRAA